MKYLIEELLFLDGKWWGGIPWGECPICKRHGLGKEAQRRIKRGLSQEPSVDITTTKWYKKMEKNNGDIK